MTYPTISAFAKLEGPLIKLEFIEVRGITGGLGYNSSMRYPKIEGVVHFPFMEINTGSKPSQPDALMQLAALTDGSSKGWVSPQVKSFWIAAGLGVRAFQFLDVMQKDISDNKFRLGLFGEALAVQPLGAAQGNGFWVANSSFSATIDPRGGIFCVQRLLNPNSFILSKCCHLTGDFALAYFFAGSGHDGDWLFTVGGYDPAYQVPVHYPDPPRLGISWTYDSEISTIGGADLAITPQWTIGGGRLDAIYQSGRLRATFTAHSDFLINYKPFRFEADVGVEIDVRVTIGWGILFLARVRDDHYNHPWGKRKAQIS